MGSAASVEEDTQFLDLAGKESYIDRYLRQEVVFAEGNNKYRVWWRRAEDNLPRVRPEYYASCVCVLFAYAPNIYNYRVPFRVHKHVETLASHTQSLCGTFAGRARSDKAAWMIHR